MTTQLAELESNPLFQTKPLLRPEQAENLRHDIESAEAKLSNNAIQDKGEVRRQLLRLRKSYNEQAPKPFANADEEGAAAKLSRRLLDEIIQDGMLSHAEMRACPPGAPDENLRWQRDNKRKVLAWKNLQLRLRPGEQEAANLERYRPTLSRLNLDNAVVPRAMHFNVENVSGQVIVLSEKEMDALRAMAPEIAESVATMSNDERALAKRLIAGFVTT